MLDPSRACDLHGCEWGVFPLLLEIGMWPEGFEQLSFDDQVFLFRLNLRCVAVLLLATVLIVLNCTLEGQVLGALGSAGLAALADQAEWVLRRLDALAGVDELRPGADRRPPPRNDQRVKHGERADHQRSAGS
jgi:hypothetical protein